MDQSSIVRFLHLKGLDATKIHCELEAVLGPDPMPYSKPTRTSRSAIWTQTDPETSHSEIDDTIVQALGKLPFASVKELARRLCCAPTAIYRHSSSYCQIRPPRIDPPRHDRQNRVAVPFFWQIMLCKLCPAGSLSAFPDCGIAGGPLRSR
jgi:hypothetical protein